MPSPTPRAELERFDCAVRIDDRAGSKDLEQHLIRLGLTTRLERLPAGDVEIIGIDGTVVGVEYKQWSDVLACVRSGRFAEQLRGMRREFHVSWLLIEGRVRVDEKNRIHIMQPDGRWREAELFCFDISSRSSELSGIFSLFDQTLVISYTIFPR